MWPDFLRFRSLRAKLLAAFLLVILVPMLATAVYGYFITGRVLSEQAVRTATQAVNLQAEHMVRSLAQAQGDVLYLSRMRSLDTLRRQPENGAERETWRDEAEQDFMVLLSVRPMYRAFRFLNTAGQEIIHVRSDGQRVSSATVLGDLSGEPYVQVALNAPPGAVTVSSFSPEDGGEPLVHYALRVNNGVLLIDTLARWILSNLPSSGQHSWALTDQDLNYLVYPDGMIGLDGVDASELQGLLEGGAGSFDTESDVIFYNTIVPSASDPSRFWVLFRQTPRSVVFAGVTDFYQKATVAFAMALVLAAGVALLVAEGIAGPVRRLTWMTAAFGRGGKAPPAPASVSADEIGELTATFCAMALELERKRDEARMLIDRLIEAQEEERKLVAYDLHDGLIQQLVGARFYLTNWRASSPPEMAGNESSFQRGCDALSEAIVEGRRIIEGLRPSALDDLGLQAALRDLAEHSAQAAGWELSLDLKPLPAEPEKTVGVTLYRVAQEALNNARKHAGARHVSLSMANGSGISLKVQDDGVGFDLKHVEEQGRGLGITTMSERVMLLNGNYEIRSAPQEGTVVSLWVPWEPGGGVPELKIAEA
ncbi:MAG: sensor histidine kinase [Anaerolineae bacterium]|nr:sensor histidine kinase [Anaerolineae bacterium]